MGSKWRSRKGSTLVEVVAAILILAVVVTAVLTGISFSQRTILSESTQGAAAAQAQNLADTLVSKLHGLSTAAPASVSVSGAEYVEPDKFPDVAKNTQYTFYEVAAGEIQGYRIKTAVYFTDGAGRKCIQMTAFAAKDGD